MILRTFVYIVVMLIRYFAEQILKYYRIISLIMQFYFNIPTTICIIDFIEKAESISDNVLQSSFLESAVRLKFFF